MIETITNSVFLAGALAGAALIGLAWLIFSKSSEHEAEADRLKEKVQADAKRIMALNDQIETEQGANKLLADDVRKADAEKDEMRERSASQDAEIARVEQINEALRADVIAAQNKFESVRHMSVDARLTSIKGIGDKVEGALNKIGVRSIFDLSEMEEEKLAEAMEKAKVPARLGNPKGIQKQARSLVTKFEKSLAG